MPVFPCISQYKPFYIGLYEEHSELVALCQGKNTISSKKSTSYGTLPPNTPQKGGHLSSSAGNHRGRCTL